MKVLVTLYKKYERYLSPTALVTGFIFDSLTLTRVDLFFDNLVILAYLCIAITCILLMNAYDAGLVRAPRKKHYAETIYPWLPIIMQFAFGGLFSAYVVFYSRSASWASSWVFVVLLGFLLVGNEFFQRRYRRVTFHITILFVALFSFLIFSVPIVLKTFGFLTFVLSGVLSLIVITGVSKIVLSMLKSSDMVHTLKRSILFSIGSVYIVFHIFYLTNIIPPVPFSLQDIGVYYNVTRLDDDTYTAVQEDKHWLTALFERRETIHLSTGTPLYVFSAVFAPTQFTTTVYHRWSYFADSGSSARWVTTDIIPFSITGGRDGGYRGYTTKRTVPPGVWRVDVVTEHNKILGRKQFEVVESSADEHIVREDVLL